MHAYSFINQFFFFFEIALFHLLDSYTKNEKIGKNLHKER